MLLFALFLSLALTAASPLNLSYFESFAPNLTAISRCTPSDTYRKWTSNYFLVEDCFAAVNQVFIDYVARGPDIPYEFHALGWTHVTKNPWIRTPAKWTVSEWTNRASWLSISLNKELGDPVHVRMLTPV